MYETMGLRHWTTIFNICKRIEILQSMFSNINSIKLKISIRKMSWNPPQYLDILQQSVNDPYVKNENKRKTKGKMIRVRIVTTSPISFCPDPSEKQRNLPSGSPLLAFLMVCTLCPLTSPTKAANSSEPARKSTSWLQLPFDHEGEFFSWAWICVTLMCPLNSEWFLWNHAPYRNPFNSSVPHCPSAWIYGKANATGKGVKT